VTKQVPTKCDENRRRCLREDRHRSRDRDLATRDPVPRFSERRARKEKEREREIVLLDNQIETKGENALWSE